MHRDHLQAEYNRLHLEATSLAGGLTDLSQRAAVYRYLFLESGGNHVFPLIAAHGALWAGGYFRFGMQLGQLLSWQYVGQHELRVRQLQQLSDFANAFRDINRRVCIDTYANFHFTDRFGDDPLAAEFVSPDLLAALQQVHAARRAGRVLSDREKQGVFEAHFRHEQANVVGPALETAVKGFEWPLMRLLALRPIVRFAFFPHDARLWFTNFASREERIEKGLAAFDLATRAGWETVDASLQRYHVLPSAFFTSPSPWFAGMRRSVLALA